MQKSRETRKSLRYALPFPKHPRTQDSSFQSSCAWLPATRVPRALLRGMLTLPGSSRAHWGWPQGKEHMDRGGVPLPPEHLGHAWCQLLRALPRVSPDLVALFGWVGICRVGWDTYLHPASACFFGRALGHSLGQRLPRKQPYLVPSLTFVS